MQVIISLVTTYDMIYLSMYILSAMTEVIKIRSTYEMFVNISVTKFLIKKCSFDIAVSELALFAHSF